MIKKPFFFIMAALLLNGCAAEINMSEVASQPADNEMVTPDTNAHFHPERYTEEQKAYILSYGTTHEWEMEAISDWTVEDMLLGTGIETGHKTSGIARGFSYEGNKTDIPETAGDELLTPEVIEQWMKEGKDFRLEEIAPYRHTISWREEFPNAYVHPVDCDEEFFQNASGCFTIGIAVDYNAFPCQMTIVGGVTEDRIAIVGMTVTFGDEEDRWGGSVYQHMNFIRTVLKDENQSLKHVTVDVMAGSVDAQGCYLTFTNNTDKDYKVPEQALVDGEIPVQIMRINGEAMGDYKELPAHAPEMKFYAEWDSLEHGEHELTVELKGTFGRKKQITVPFTY